MTKISQLPKYHELMKPTLDALDGMGGSGSLNEINNKVSELMGFQQADLDVQYDSGSGAVVPDRMSWARSYLKTAGLVESGGRGVWAITDQGRLARSWTDTKLKTTVVEAVKAEYAARIAAKPAIEGETTDSQGEQIDWRDSLLQVLRSMEPSGFERLCQRLLRESGFVKVEVTGRSGDGGIDGKGILQLSLMSFHVLFQCKRYQGAVGSSAVRDFRGAMMGRTDKGLMITTGRFSADAGREATRDGAPPIDLIDGDTLCEKLKELGLGVTTKQVEVVEINAPWFQAI